MRWHTAIFIAVLGVTMIANFATADLIPFSNGPRPPKVDPNEPVAPQKDTSVSDDRKLEIFESTTPPAAPQRDTSVSDRGYEFAVAGGALVVAAACGGFWLIRRKKQLQ